MTARRVDEEPWSWVLYDTPDGLALVVLCGTVGLFEVAVRLDDTEAAAWRAEGRDALLPLVDAVRGEPAAWRTRQIPAPEPP